MVIKKMSTLFKIQKPYIWIFIAIAFRLLLFLHQASLPKAFVQDGVWGHYACDTPAYFEPIDNLLVQGSYKPDFRMPGYGGLYFLLRLLFSFPTTCNVIVLLQIIMSGIAVYLLALKVLHITKSEKVFLAVYILSLISTYSATYDAYLLTESFCTSAGIFSFYFLCRGLSNSKQYNFLWAGLFFTWMVFLKPVFAALFLIIILALLLLFFLKKLQKDLSISLKSIFVLIVPFLFLDGLWAVRNFSKQQKLNVLTNPFFIPKGEKEYPHALTVFLQSWGGVHSVWMPNGHNRWFEGDETEKNNIHFPDFLFKGSITLDSLVMTRNLVQETYNKSLSPEKIKTKDLEAQNAFIRFAHYVKKEQPLRYFLYAPLKYLKMFYADSGTYLLYLKPFANINIFQKSIRVVLSVLHYIILICGTLSALFILLTFKKHHFLMLLPALAVFFSFLIFPLVLRMPEARFMVPVFPFQLVCLVLTVWLIYKKFYAKVKNI